MKDFKNSYEQKSWEDALEGYARAKRALGILTSLSNAEKHAEYWKKRCADYEKRYPMLLKQEGSY